MGASFRGTLEIRERAVVGDARSGCPAKFDPKWLEYFRGHEASCVAQSSSGARSLACARAVDARARVRLVSVTARLAKAPSGGEQLSAGHFILL